MANIHWVARNPVEVARRESCVLCQLPLGAQTPSGGRQERALRSVPTSTGCSDTQWRSPGERAAFCANFHWVLRHPVEVVRRERCVLCQLPLGAQTPSGGGQVEWGGGGRGSEKIFAHTFFLYRMCARTSRSEVFRSKSVTLAKILAVVTLVWAVTLF